MKLLYCSLTSFDIGAVSYRRFPTSLLAKQGTKRAISPLDLKAVSFIMLSQIYG